MKTKLLYLLLNIAHIATFTAVLFLILLGIDVAFGMTTLWGYIIMLISTLHVTICSCVSAIKLKDIL